MLMLSGVSPNVQHVSLRRGQIRVTSRLLEAAGLGRPQWAGFHPDPASRSVARHEVLQLTHYRGDAPGDGARCAVCFSGSTSRTTRCPDTANYESGELKASED